MMRFLALTIILFFSALAYAGEPTRLDLLRSDYYADQAQEQFGLTKEARDAFKQLKLGNMMAYREVVAPLKKKARTTRLPSRVRSLTSLSREKQQTFLIAV